MKLTYGLIAVCIIVFIFFGCHTPSEQEKLFELYGFSGYNLFHGRPWTIVTSIFVHGNVGHLILNMIALFFFGRTLEEEITGIKFMLIFISGGIVGNIFCLFFYPFTEYVVGASAAIFSIMGAAMIKRPFEFIFFPSIVPVPVIYAALIFIFSDVLAVFFGITGNPNIAHVGHLGGLATGLLWGLHEAGFKRTLLVILLIIISVVVLMPFLLLFFKIFDYTSIISSLV